MLNNAKRKGDRQESVKSIINSLLKLTKGHERYPHDTVKIDGYPISYAQVKDIAQRLRTAQRREDERIEQMMSDIYWKNKNVLKFGPTLFNRDLRGKSHKDAINLRWCMMYATELQDLIHWYGFKKEYAERDEKEPWNTTSIVEKSENSKSKRI